MGRSTSFKAFISYSHADERWASWLHRTLESYRIPRSVVERHGLDSNRLGAVFRDRDELASTSDLTASIRDNLERSENLVVVCSPAAAGSRWVNEEIRHFQSLGRGRRVFCLLVDDPANSFPEAVLAADEDGGKIEPLAADARDVGDGRRDARLKLISGLLDLDYDELRQREAGRRLKRMTIAAASAGAIALALGVLSVVALMATHRAEREATKAQAISSYLQDMLVQADTARNEGKEVTVRELLDRANRELPEELAAEPEVALSIRRTVANTYVSVGDFEQAGEVLDEALALARERFGADSPEALETFLDFLRLERRLGRASEALPLLEEQFGAFEALDDPWMLASALQLRGELAFDLGRVDEARADLDDSLALQAPLDEAEAWELRLATLVSKATLLRREGDLDEAERLQRESLALLDRYGGAPSDAQRAAVQNNLGLLLRDKGDAEAAIELLRQSLETRVRLNGESHPETAIAMTNLGNLLRQQGALREASDYLERSLAAHRAIYEDDYPGTAITMQHLASTLIDLDRTEAEEPVRLATEALAMFERIFGPAHPGPAVSALTLCNILNDAGRPLEARAPCDRAESGLTEQLGAGHSWVALAQLAGAESAIQLNELSLAARQLDAAQTILDNAGEEDSLTYALYDHRRGRLAFRAGRWDEARDWFERELALRESLQPGHYHAGRALIWLSKSLAEQGDEAAAATAQRARDLLGGTLGDAHFLTREAERELATIREGVPAS